MTTTQNGSTAGSNRPVKNTFKQGRHFTPIRHNAGAIIAPGAKHAKEVAVVTHTESWVFSRPEFMSLGLGVSIPQGRQHGYFHVFTPSPIRLSKQQASGCKSQVGANQMAHANSTPTPSMQGTPHHTSLSFVRIERKGPRNQRLTNWFNVPDEDYCAGNARGYRIAGEFVNWLQQQPTTYETGMIAREVMAAAFAVLAQPHTPCAHCKRGAAVSFLDAMAGFIQFAAQQSNHDVYLPAKAQQCEDWARESAQLDAERNRQTGLRLAAARKAKRAARMVEGGVQA